MSKETKRITIYLPKDLVDGLDEILSRDAFPVSRTRLIYEVLNEYVEGERYESNETASGLLN